MPETTSAEGGLKGGNTILQKVVNADDHLEMAEQRGEDGNREELSRYGRKSVPSTSAYASGIYQIQQKQGRVKGRKEGRKFIEFFLVFFFCCSESLLKAESFQHLYSLACLIILVLSLVCLHG